MFGFAAAAAAAAAENVTISNFHYVAVSGYPQISFDLSVDSESCEAVNYTVPGFGYPCDKKAEWTFDVLSFDVIANGGRHIRLHHTVENVNYTGDFDIRLTGPIPTVLDQVGTSTAEMEPTS
ncbi:hypothetical protein COCC4DRAFT_128535 [Bipolaris maydis ATCC 48331]|uniref:AA1-like domain-containing protein n=3 Tax=Cochliobolus heterostrophus TaxID=5016 RepID=M2UCJ8_COCH5|nr:uncharacterized protein COCC4DRAFT_128535 [Bipolaris maydis ATCC 48331]EMD91406.1 hypothetical protein COCHEDRAFT_1102571 [Bipolaris maydis C5]ENI08837.1 hypothetical protein COCC4DRAFT_128535 [Bipolaris maydis ATCC 48331]KAJ6208803.1 hypothetical protein PSV09DRAFT_1102571 [Bipolaris maydis]